MRAILDPVDPADLRTPFREIFRRLQRAKRSNVSSIWTATTCCPSTEQPTTPPAKSIVLVPVKNHRNGNTTYSHQLLGATLVHPDLKEVIPLVPEPIIHQDGQTKNDCERNATSPG